MIFERPEGDRHSVQVQQTVKQQDNDLRKEKHLEQNLEVLQAQRLDLQVLFQVAFQTVVGTETGLEAAVDEHVQLIVELLNVAFLWNRRRMVMRAVR